MIGGDTSTPPIWRTVLTEFPLHATSASGATDATAALRNGVFATKSGGSLGSYLPQHIDLQAAKLAVGDDEEVAAAAGGVEEPQRAELVPELPQVSHGAAVPAGLEPPEKPSHPGTEIRAIGGRAFLTGPRRAGLGAARRRNPGCHTP